MIRYLVFGAAYIGPYSEWSWIWIVAVIIIGIFLFWILYKLVLGRIAWKKDENHLGDTEPIKRVVINEQEEVDKDGITKIHSKEEDVEADEEIVMPLSGELIALEKVPDPIFSTKVIGDGFAINPNKEEIVAPINGIIKECREAVITFNTNSGRDVVLHVGLNTSELMHKGIRFDVKEGDRVKAGQKIGSIDLEQMKVGAKSMISPVVFSNLKETDRVVIKDQGLVEAGMKGLVVIEEDAQY